MPGILNKLGPEWRDSPKVAQFKAVWPIKKDQGETGGSCSNKVKGYCVLCQPQLRALSSKETDMVASAIY
jgi:hypothetical protein